MKAKTAPLPPVVTTEGTLKTDWSELIKYLIDLALPRSDDIPSCPAKLGQLLSICAEFTEIQPVIRERATTLALQKTEIPGWVLVHRDSNRYVEERQVLEVCRSCQLTNLPNLVTTLVRQLGNVSETKFNQLCESAGLLAPLEGAVKHSGQTVFLRRNATQQNQTP